MKKLLTIAALAVLLSNQVKAQYYENAYPVIHHTTWATIGYTHINVFAVDFLGRSIIGGDNRPCTSCDDEVFFQLPQPQAGIGGNYVTLNDITTDASGNVYVSGNSSHEVYFDANHSIYDNGNTMYFIVKFNIAGQFVWVKIMDSNYHSIAVNNAGSILYASSDTQVVKMNAVSGNNSLPPKIITGGQLVQDASGNCLVLTASSLTKLNKTTLNVVWTRTNAGGNELYSGNTNNIYVISNTYVKKVTSGNSLVYTYPNGGITLVANPAGEVYAGDATGVHKINSTGTAQLWFMEAAGLQHLAIYGADEIYVAGTFRIDLGIQLCPFHFIENYTNDGDCGYVAKINDALPIPFQAAITCTPPVDGFDPTQICLSNSINIPFSVCMNAGSQFAPGNTFYVELVDPSGNNPINIGPPNNAVIPDSIPSGSYNFRVNATNPPVTGETSFLWWQANNYQLNNYSAHISAVGPTGVCATGSVKIKAVPAANQYYRWYVNNTLVDTLPYNQDSIIITAPCTVYCEYHGATSCHKTSNTIYVTNNIPLAPIAALGATTFCAGDSVKLATNNCNGCTYQWKKNGINIASANTYQYTAKFAGNYKVIVTGANGCTKASASKTITVNCREAGDITTDATSNAILIYPNPAKDQLHIDCAVTKGTATLIIKNILGQEIYRKTVEATDDGLSDDINIKELNEGIYVLSVYASGEIYSGKFVKE